MTNRAEEHVEISREFISKAHDALTQHDLLQASEKLWGAAAHMVKAVAETRGWAHSGHRELFQVVNRLVDETGNGELRPLFDAANSLHSNFYENWMPEVWIEDGARRVREFIAQLEQLP